jgi:hypothetical protein
MAHQVNGFRNAQFKGFRSLGEAQEYMQGDEAFAAQHSVPMWPTHGLQRMTPGVVKREGSARHARYAHPQQAFYHEDSDDAYSHAPVYSPGNIDIDQEDLYRLVSVVLTLTQSDLMM